MTTPTFTPSPQFERAVIDTAGVLRAAMAQLERMRADVHECADELDLLDLYTIALLAEQRARHLVAKMPEQIDVDDTLDLPELLVTTLDQLIDQTSGLEPLEVLEFISDVGDLYRGVRRYGHNH